MESEQDEGGNNNAEHDAAFSSLEVHAASENPLKDFMI
jgi:hypothetical protein